MNKACQSNEVVCAEAFGFLLKVENENNGNAYFIPTDDFTTDVTWSADGRLLHSIMGAKVFSWDASSRQLLRTLGGFFTGPLYSVIWSSRGDEIASGQAVWNATTAQLIRSRRCAYGYGSDSSDCQWPAMRLETNYHVYAYNQATGRALRHFVPHHIVSTVAILSADKRSVVTSGGDRCVKPKQGYNCQVVDASTRVWDFQSFSKLAELPVVFYDMDISPDGQIIAGHTSTALEVWDWQKQQKLWSAAESIGYQCPLGYYAYYYSCYRQPKRVSASPLGDLLASFSESNSTTIHLYRLNTGELITTFTGHTAPITGVAFSQDGTEVAASSLDGTILIWALP